MEKKQSRKELLSRLVSTGGHACLLQPAVDAALSARRDALSAVAAGWLAFTATLQQRSSSPAEASDTLLEAAHNAVTMCDAAGRAVAGGGVLTGADLLGAYGSAAELPLATAATVYIIRCGILEALSEPGQRTLLQRLTLRLTRGGGAGPGEMLSVPAQAAVLQVMAAVLETLSEVDAEAGGTVEAAVSPLVSGTSSTVVSHAAANVMAALAVAMPMAAARLLGSMLDGLDDSCRCLLVVGASSGSTVQRSSMVSLNAVPGFSLVVAMLLAASPRLPLGLPSALHAKARSLAERCILSPLSIAAPSSLACSTERRAGYVVLGALITCSHADDATQAADSWLSLLCHALGPSCRCEVLLDDRAIGSDTELAYTLSWRSAALQALVAYLEHIVARGLAGDPLAPVTTIAERLAPLLDTIIATPWLQEPRLARGGPAGVLAAAAAGLQLCLLQAYEALPLASRLLLGAHTPIIKLGLSALRSAGAGGAPGAPEALLSSCLLDVLTKEDTPLGPWLPGRDALQDELTCYVGERGGPLPPPWHCAGAPVRAGAAVSAADQGGWSADGAAIQGAMTDVAASRQPVRPFLPAHGLGCALLEKQLLLLGKLLALISQPSQLQVRCS